MSEPFDELERGLGGLRTFDAGPERVERIRARCLVALTKQRQRGQGWRLRFTAQWRRLEPAVALCLSVAYLAVAFDSSFALLR